MPTQAFYDRVTKDLFRGSLPDWQREPLDRLIDEGIARGKGVRKIAYVLATAYHETARFQYMEEIGKGHGKAYAARCVVMGTGSAVTETAQYHGRGFVQLTWLGNYARMSAALGRDLVSDPDLVKEPAIAAEVIWRGMLKGMFTGKRLSDYVGGGQTDYVGARRTVNGTDKADLIAGYAEAFAEALRA
ncbi:MAG: putative chitinase class I [Prokaryotic dsDNA virus sp.]|nr:MAG: putative chitinase class I [Prokaryotic dsDNA virus sp.]|tara:strand:- start:953 stop:1516 length:564 start_codon:yes stop_codon:yes gene_type:complete